MDDVKCIPGNIAAQEEYFGPRMTELISKSETAHYVAGANRAAGIGTDCNSFGRGHIPEDWENQFYIFFRNTGFAAGPKRKSLQDFESTAFR